MRMVTALGQRGAKFRTTLGQYDLLFDYHRVAGKVRGFFRSDLNQAPGVMPNGPLPIIIESAGKPKSASIGQWTETCIEMVKPVFNQLDRDDQPLQGLADNLM